MDVSQAQEAKQLREENTRLRKLVADLSLDKEALQSVIRKNGYVTPIPTCTKFGQLTLIPARRIGTRTQREAYSAVARHAAGSFHP
jgi:hypothetical protein